MLPSRVVTMLGFLRCCVILMTCLLAACRVDISFDERQGCVVLDGVQRCSDLSLDFEAGDRHTLAARPFGGYSFSHWRRGDRHLFGGSSAAQHELDTRALGDDLPSGSFSMGPEFVAQCYTDYSGDNSSAHPYLDCYGDRLNTNWAFADLSGLDVVHRVSVLFYVDTGIADIANGRLSAEELVRQQLTVVNQALANSGVHMRIDAAQTLTMSGTDTGPDSVEDTLSKMVDGQRPFNSMLQHKAFYDADLVHSLIPYSSGSLCGQAYVGVVDAPENYQVGVSTCHWDALILAHELGHNFGLDHANVSIDETFATFPYGRAQDKGRARTIMVGEGESLPYFSSPELFTQDPFTGAALKLGSDNIDSVRMLNKVRLDYARIRPQIRTASAALGKSSTQAVPLRLPPKRH